MTTPSDATPDEPDSAPASAPKKSGWRKAKRWLLVALATPVLLFILYTVFAYNWSYSDGDRSGILRKFSRKGWLCKTWEGELAMTTVPGSHAGTLGVHGAGRLRRSQGHLRRSASRWRCTMTSTGDSGRGVSGRRTYFVDSVRVLE